ncbi:TPM domain-containing protein [Streptomyces polyrhachis]|uniref:TPM domain-containing protein n=1 Tax=Streptomyces polyrhachis TaxID=1282885 RepID=A0ABW2GGT5_9ACTN
MHIRRPAAALAAALALLLAPGAAPAAGASADTVATRDTRDTRDTVSTVDTAPAVDPVNLDRGSQITDRVDALGERRPQVAKALSKLDEEHRVQLYVVYVRDFAGRGGQDWADATAQKNGLGQDDVLLAVATHARQYAVSAATDSGLTAAQIREVNAEAVEPALRRNDWAGAAIGAADGLGAVLSGSPVPRPVITPGPADPGGSTNSGAAVLIPVVLVGAVILVVYLLYVRRRRANGGAPTPGGAPARTPPEVPLPELDARARQALVETDDAVRTSEEELGFAAAQFGEETAAPFQEAVGFAKQELTGAFRLRQQLDDAHPEDDAAKRRMLEEIVQRCARASERLDAESDAFDSLRQLVAGAPEALARAEAAAQRLPTEINTAESALSTMAASYPPSAAEAVSDHPRAARERFQFAATHLSEARGALDAGNRDAAAVHIRAAEGAIDQAATLAGSVLRRQGELREAGERLGEALRDAHADLADARGMVGGTPAGDSTADLRGRIGRLESVVAEVEGEMTAGPYDPLTALRRIEEADAALEESLTGAREREAADHRARVLLDQALLAARSEVGAARDFLTTHRGAVASQARTRLHEAERHLEQAVALSTSDAPAALQHAQRADQLGREARSLAEQDTAGYGPGPGRMGGGGLNTAMLGGLILGGMLGGSGGGGGGGGFGGGGGGFGPGSFGGVGTTGRMGGGGRF